MPVIFSKCLYHRNDSFHVDVTIALVTGQWDALLREDMFQFVVPIKWSTDIRPVVSDKHPVLDEPRMQLRDLAEEGIAHRTVRSVCRDRKPVSRAQCPM